ncbi:hypothetical protein [Oscillatoria sp. CS-180]|uniref:hypothetical protein n=1 Tax=Oscillatoria sp. CS-180 TaxID=3021720 RepID=UPI0023304777|nr:hypothetical protein [Oscillatoria sp. CS-180]
MSFVRHRSLQRLFTVCLVGILSLVSAMAIAVAPSYAQVPFDSQEAHGQTLEDLTGRPKGAPLSDEERLDRAYTISEAAGLREEKRQAEGKVDPKEGNRSLVEKAKDAVEDVIGK